jgi:hypothetical protein
MSTFFSATKTFFSTAPPEMQLQKKRLSHLDGTITPAIIQY